MSSQIADREASELRSLFVAEAEDHLTSLEERLIELEKRPLESEELRAAFRAAHTIKGGASLLGFDAVERLAHATEDVLASLRDGPAQAGSDVVTLLLRSVDALREMIGTVAEDETPSVGPVAALLADLASWKPSEASVETPESAGDPVLGKGALPRDGVEVPASRALGSRTLHVDVAKLDRLLDVAGEIALARRLFASRLAEMKGPESRALREAHEDSGHIVSELQEAVMELRMVPLGPLFRRFGRAVRDVAGEQGKDVTLVFEGEDVEVDTAIVERLADPLTHLVRNAVDHGIESPDTRRSAGKPSQGTVSLRARRGPAQVVIEVCDDGAGVGREPLVRQAGKHGIRDAEGLDDEGLKALVFRPGFSTAETVSDLSGRGVGLDAVRRMVEGMRGHVHFDSREGEGTTVTLRLPLTLSVVGGLEVRVGGGTYIVPLESVVECMELPGEAGGARGIFELGGATLPWVRLRDLFEAGGEVPRPEQMLIVRQGSVAMGLVVDRLLGEAESIVRPLGEALESARPFGGSAVLEDGRIGLVIDVPSLIREMLDSAAMEGPVSDRAPEPRTALH